MPHLPSPPNEKVVDQTRNDSGLAVSAGSDKSSGGFVRRQKVVEHTVGKTTTHSVAELHTHTVFHRHKAVVANCTCLTSDSA